MTLDNYIMEQDINTVSVGDIYVEQALAEMEVTYALAASYMKDAMFVEYMTEMTGQVYQEADDASDDKTKKSFKERAASIGGKVKGAPGKIWAFIKSMGSAIVTAITNAWHYLTEKSISKCIVKLRSMGNLGTTYDVPANFKTILTELLDATDYFCDYTDEFLEIMTAEGSTINTVNHPNIYNKLKDMIKIASVDKEHSEKMNVTDLLDVFEDLNRSEVSARIKEAIKKFKDIVKIADKNLKAAYKENKDSSWSKDGYKDIKNINKNSLKEMKDIGKAIVKKYDQVVREYRTVANKVLKEQHDTYKDQVKSEKFVHKSDVNTFKENKKEREKAEKEAAKARKEGYRLK